MGSCLGNSGWFRVPLSLPPWMLLPRVVSKAWWYRRAKPFLRLQNYFDDDSAGVELDVAVGIQTLAAAAAVVVVVAAVVERLAGLVVADSQLVV